MTERSSQQYLSFHLDGEEYCISILSVQEIKGWVPVKPIPDAPKYMKGVINLRGKVIPIVDLRVRFGLTSVEYTPTTVVIVVNIQRADKSIEAGVVVDAVAEVYDLDDADIQTDNELVTGINENFVSGVATIDEHMVTVVDINSVFDFESLEAVNQ